MFGTSTVSVSLLLTVKDVVKKDIGILGVKFHPSYDMMCTFITRGITERVFDHKIDTVKATNMYTLPRRQKYLYTLITLTIRSMSTYICRCDCIDNYAL